ncbi:abortive infection protein [Halorubrum sp. DTA46]|uniref:abortive infection protein n=1 Tax=Halorubrum sp. DTA46 TaxID=3402162 RepID=UPI003AAA5C9B
MTGELASSRQEAIPFWTLVALAALYLPVTLVAETLLDPSAAAGIAALDPVAAVGGSLLATVVAGAIWTAIAVALLVAFRAELDAMRRGTAWRPPDKGYLILAVGALLAHPVSGRPFVFLVVAGYTLHRGLRVR